MIPKTKDLGLEGKFKIFYSQNLSKVTKTLRLASAKDLAPSKMEIEAEALWQEASKLMLVPHMVGQRQALMQAVMALR